MDRMSCWIAGWRCGWKFCRKISRISCGTLGRIRCWTWCWGLG